MAEVTVVDTKYCDSRFWYVSNVCFCALGIFCLDRLEPILDLVSSTVQKKESKLIIQKYIGENNTDADDI